MDNAARLGVAKLAIAGVNTRPLQRACLGIAGNLSSTIRPAMRQLDLASRQVAGQSLGDTAASGRWDRACYLLDASYIVCTDLQGGVRWRNWAAEMFASGQRRLPLFLDSGAFRRAQGTAPGWFTYDSYLQAIDLVQPDGYMAFDVWADAGDTLRYYERMISDGYGDRLIPVWQMGPTWDDRAGTVVKAPMSEAARVAIANARLAARDPILQHYAARHRLIAIGGMVQGPCPREVRHVYLAELCRLFPDHQFWALGQACAPVANGLGPMGLLDRVWLDGSWWIHNARTECLVVVQDGLLKSIRLASTGAKTFFTMAERLVSGIRSLHSAYRGDWVWPAPAEVPTEMEDLDARLELKRRLAAAQMDLFDLMPQEVTG